MDHFDIQRRSIPPFFSTRTTGKALLALFVLITTACGNDGSPSRREEKGRGAKDLAPSRFELDKEAYGYRLRIRSGSSGSKEQLYHLIERGKEAPENVPGALQVPVPVKRIACLSSTHAGMLLALNESERIAALSSKDHLYHRGLRKRMEKGRIEAVGMQRSLNTEKLISLKIDLILANGMSGSSKSKGKLQQKAGIPSLDILAWKEAGPIARLKWLRVLGVLTGKKASADSLIELRSKAYDSIAALIDGKKRTPEVLCNAPHKGTWHVPGGKSFMARMIRDAGGEQPWPENEATGGVPKSLEEVIAKGGDADIWLNPGQATSLQGLRSVDNRIARIEAFKKAEVYKNDRRKVEGGGNDHWESGIVHPELILADLAQIFHPELFPERELHYYRELPKEQS